MELLYCLNVISLPEVHFMLTSVWLKRGPWLMMGSWLWDSVSLSSELTLSLNLRAQTSFVFSLSPPSSHLVLSTCWFPSSFPRSLTPLCTSFPAGCAVATVGYGVGVSTGCQSTPLPLLLLLLRPTPPLPPPPSGSCAEHIHPGNEAGWDTKDIIPSRKPDPDPFPYPRLLYSESSWANLFCILL